MHFRYSPYSLRYSYPYSHPCTGHEHAHLSSWHYQLHLRELHIIVSLEWRYTYKTLDTNIHPWEGSNYASHGLWRPKSTPQGVQNSPFQWGDNQNPQFYMVPIVISLFVYNVNYNNLYIMLFEIDTERPPPCVLVKTGILWTRAQFSGPRSGTQKLPRRA